MSSPPKLLNCVARATLDTVGNHLDNDRLAEALPDLVRITWDQWSRGRDEVELRAEVQEIAQASNEDLRKQAVALAEAAPAPVKEALVAYLAQVPSAIRQSLRRPADPSGRSVPAGLGLRKADDLAPLLPVRLPRFKAGDRPPGMGDWQLEELLGVGGFGEVWRATNPHFPSADPVALKFCLDPLAAKVLRNEASILDKVMRHGRHPGIVQLRHTYLSAEPPCLEYEYVSGGDLASVIQDWHRAGGAVGPALVGQAAGVVRHLAEVVAFAHQHGIVHRDLKPANILVQRQGDGRVALRVADFGIGGVATRQASAESMRPTARTSSLATVVRGAYTPLYASPQQMRGDPADPRDDVHALGVIWLQCLTGQLAAGRPSGTRWTQRLAQQGLSAPLIDLLASCMEDDPNDRPAHAGALAKQLADLQPAPLQAVPAQPSKPAGPATVVVSRLGRGNFAHISDAIAAVPAGSRIVVQPGIYQEALVLDRPLEIVGEGPVENIIVQSTDTDCVLMKTDYAVLQGLTLRARMTKTNKVFFGVDVPQGQLVLEGCHITSECGACVGIHGPGAGPVLRRCLIHDGRQTGVLVYDRARATLDDCEVRACKLAGIEVSHEASPQVQRCHIHSGQSNGIYVHSSGQGTFDHCDVRGHALAGVEIKSRGAPTIRHTKVHEGRSSGVYVHEGGEGTFEQCVISGNAHAGVGTKKQGKPTLRRCIIGQNRYEGLWAYDGGGAVVEDCDLTGNARGPWDIGVGCAVTQRGNRT